MPLYSRGFINPMTTEGDIIVGGVGGVPTRLALGADADVLTAGASTLAWAGAASGGEFDAMSPIPYGYNGWTFNPILADNDAEIVSGGSGKVYLCPVHAVTTGDINNILFDVAQAPTALTPTENYVAIYGITLAAGILSELTLLGQSASGVLEALLTGAAGLLSVPLSAPVPVVAGTMYYIGLLYNGGGAALKHSTANGTASSAGQEVAYPAMALSNGGLVALPATIGPPIPQELTSAIWAAIGP